tara:strand:+ start:937 stop:1116 length:180 start_codon:yes stop_codon:yes gene_type:complete
MKQKNKFVYLYIIQGNYGQGWEDIAASESWKESRSDLKAYRENMPEYPYRRIKRREANA